MTYAETAKKLDCSFRVWKYGFKLSSPRLGGGRKFISIVPLDGWIFDPHEIMETMANDPDFSISYKDKE